MQTSFSQVGLHNSGKHAQAQEQRKEQERPTASYEPIVSSIMNICVSVTIVLYNKRIFQVLKFPAPVTLSAIHSLFGHTLLTLIAGLGAFEPKNLNRALIVKQSIIWGVSVAFDLLSLKYNSVGFFQIAKLSMLPLAAVLNMYMTGDRPSRNVIMSLGWITLGIAVTSVTDVQVNMTGCMFSAIAVCSTVVNQVKAGQIMKENACSSMQYTHALTFWSGSILSVAGPFVDYLATGVRVDEWVRDNYDLPLITGIVVTSVLGVLVNITAYWAIKTTGAVTYQVLGQVKNSAIIVLGFVLFSYPVLLKNVLGIMVAISGAIAYVFAKILDQRAAEAQKGPSITFVDRDEEKQPLASSSSSGDLTSRRGNRDGEQC
uniref:Sugar phosphate transporter domain-containing protein n=1 Tax=Pyramimonas obovata TaxID=1411642 RepID=A0A7S0WT22_9CHLO|mmetsp:Transcript_38636/g.84023  ORF Transcript_38636/g.84023 Transcript_38636/m.84023 type:complete len:373 (+) Transcript_38636:331-1449(+)